VLQSHQRPGGISAAMTRGEETLSRAPVDHG
jgi:hypothetical protein